MNESNSHPLTAAVNYARYGWRVFPCNGEKRPALKGREGFKDATLDADQIRTWWVDDPDYLIGIPTGGGIIVIDVDEYKPGGAPEWEADVAAHGDLPRTYTVRTGQGGRHRYYKVNETIRNSAGKTWPNVDIRGDGGYVIAPPSVSKHGAYTVEDDHDPVPCPEWILEKLRRKDVAERPTGPSVQRDKMSEAERDRLDAYTASAVEAELQRLRDCVKAAVRDASREKYTGAPWDQTTYEVACNLLEFANSSWNGYSEDNAFDALRLEAPRDAEFGLPEILKCWNSARKTTEGKVRSMPAPKGGAVPQGHMDPDKFFQPAKGLDASLLTSEVMGLGELAIENNMERSIWAYSQGVWRYAPNEIQNRCAVLLGPRFRLNHAATVEPMIQQRLEADDAKITSEPDAEWINVRNGMVYWATGLMKDHSPSFYSTVQLPVEWNEAAACPRFDKFLEGIMPEDAIDYLWEIIGYLVYSGNPLQKAILFHGNGSNGKGTLIRVLESLLGKHNTSSVTLQDITEGKFEVASLFGKIANLAGDIDPSYMKSTAKFKAITGEDQVSAQRKFQSPFDFKVWATPLFSANEFWKSADTSTGYKRRWLLVPFPNTFTITPGLSESFSAELPGILVHAVTSLRTLMARGDFAPPPSAVEEKERFDLASDQVSAWLKEDEWVKVARPGDDGVRTSLSTAYSRYKEWAVDYGFVPLNMQKYRDRLSSMGYEFRKLSTSHVIGLQVSNDHRVSYVPYPESEFINGSPQF